MKLSDLKFNGTELQDYVRYSQFLRKANGTRCRVVLIGGVYAYQWAYCFPGEQWPDMGDWRVRRDLTALDIAAIIADHTVDPCQSNTHPGPPQEDDEL